MWTQPLIAVSRTHNERLAYTMLCPNQKSCSITNEIKDALEIRNV